MENINFIDFLEQRGCIKESTPNIKETFKTSKKVYLGFDPTATSLHIGHLIPMMVLKNLLRYGHSPFAVIGGVTAMIGDPSFKSTERVFIDPEELEYNQQCIYNQLDTLFCGKIKIFNNKEWLKNITITEFLRDVGKYITINYMSSKESVKRRIEKGISFTEFTYQLIQAYDFYYLFSNYNIDIQIGGDDQWGNLTTGIELIKKKLNKEVHAFSLPLLTDSKGKKFGKTEKGNCVWLDKQKTSIYDFYQFFINCDDAEIIKLYPFLSEDDNEEIDKKIIKHKENPNIRSLQKNLAFEVTSYVHSKEEAIQIEKVSNILFSNDHSSFFDNINKLNFNDFNVLLEVVKYKEVKVDLNEEYTIWDFLNLTVIPELFDSKGDIKRYVSDDNNKLTINSFPVLDPFISFSVSPFYDNFYVIQKGKKKNIIIKVIK